MRVHVTTDGEPHQPCSVACGRDYSERRGAEEELATAPLNPIGRIGLPDLMSGNRVLPGTENISDTLPPSSLVGTHARMPLLILSMGITEPLLARRAAYGRRVGARRNARPDALTQPL